MRCGRPEAVDDASAQEEVTAMTSIWKWATIAALAMGLIALVPASAGAQGEQVDDEDY